MYPDVPDSSTVNVYVKLAYDVALAVGQGIHRLGQTKVDDLANYSEWQAAASTTYVLKHASLNPGSLTSIST